MRLLISGGGTAGHVYPALATVEALGDSPVKSELEPPHDLEILYVGSAEGIETELVPRTGLPLRTIPLGGLRGKEPWMLMLNAAKLGRGVGHAWHILGEFAPHVILATGGYVSAPVVLSGWLRRVPILFYLPDLEPGLAIGLLSGLATRVAVSFEETADRFAAHKVVVTGYPVRRAILGARRESARRTFKLSEEIKTVLLYGGSQGAHSINVATESSLEQLLELCQVVHICGSRDASWLEERRRRLPRWMQQRYRVYPYLHEEMGEALAAADLVVTRAGAATLGELPAAGVPSILIPYPYAGRHQERNASYMVERGAAVQLDDGQLAERLLPTIKHLLGDEEALTRMRDMARRLARPEAAKRLAEELWQMGREKG